MNLIKKRNNNCAHKFLERDEENGRKNLETGWRGGKK
jgi:hypothetical protein